MSDRPVTQPDEHTSPSQIIVDGIALQGALRAALAIAPSSPKKEHSVIGIQLPADDTGSVSVTARNPDTNIVFSASVPVDFVDLADDRDVLIEITIPEARRLLAQKCDLPKEEEPWPSLDWEITGSRIKQTDANVLFGRRTDVHRIDSIAQHVLGDIPAALGALSDILPSDSTTVGPTATQVKAIGTSLSHLGENPDLPVPLTPGDGQIGSVLWLSESAIIHSTIPDPDTGVTHDTGGLQAAAQDLADTMARTGATSTVVNAAPPGGIA